MAKRWKLAGRPTFCVLLKEENLIGDHFYKMLELLTSCKNGYVDGVRVRVGRVQVRLQQTGLTRFDGLAPVLSNFLILSICVTSKFLAKEAGVVLTLKNTLEFFVRFGQCPFRSESFVGELRGASGLRRSVASESAGRRSAEGDRVRKGSSRTRPDHTKFRHTLQ